MAEEKALISSIIEGDLDAFRQLIKEHERLVMHMIGRIVINAEDKEELCQDVFLKVFEKLKDFNFQSKLSTWIATIAYRHAINHIRKRKIALSELNESEGFKERFISNESIEQDVEDQDLEDKVMSYIDQLPVHYRTVITLYHVEGMSYPEIGEVTGMPEGTVKNYLFRARQLLKDKIKKHLSPDDIL